MKYSPLIIFAALFHFAGQTQQTDAFNVLSIPNGAYIIKAPPSFKSVEESSNEIVKSTKEALIDGTYSKGWCSAENAPFPMEFIIELSEECILTKIGFNTQCEVNTKGISAKEVEIQVSTSGANGNYNQLGNYSLKDHKPTRYFQTDSTRARWVKVIIHSNNGYKTFTELMEVEAWGIYANKDVKAINLTGDWTSTWGTASIRQKGSNIDGCYEFRNGTITNSGMDRRILTYEWSEEGENGVGHAALVVNEEGNRLNGIWGFGDDLKNYGIWVFRKKSGSPTLCYQDNQSKEEAKKEEVAKIEKMKNEIEHSGKLILYGINFETGSADIKSESNGILDEIYELLHTYQNMNVRIEGHTDASGSNKDNLNLSINRSESVKKYLVNKGINEGRIKAIGMGEENPVASNNTQLGRAANRRVEIKLQ